MKDIITIYNYCGCSGEAYLHVTTDRVGGSYPGKNHPISQGYLCSTDWHPHELVHSSRRLTKPLLHKDETLKALSWDEPRDFTASALKSAKAFTVTSKERKYGCC